MPAHRELHLDVSELRELARTIDRGEPGRARYETAGIEQFLDQFCDANGQPVRMWHAGPTQLAVAPTGAGKSVFARLAALHTANKGLPVSIVVLDIPTVWKEVLLLESAAKAAGLPLRIAALSSWRDTATRQAT